MLEGYGYIVAPALASAFTAIVGFVIYKRRARVDLDAERERAGIRREDQPLVTMQKALDKAYAESAAAREQVEKLMANHLEHDRQDRDRLIEVLTETKEAMRTIKDEIVEHRAEERERAGAIHARFNTVSQDIAFLKGKQ